MNLWYSYVVGSFQDDSQSSSFRYSCLVPPLLLSVDLATWFWKTKYIRTDAMSLLMVKLQKESGFHLAILSCSLRCSLWWKPVCHTATCIMERLTWQGPETGLQSVATKGSRHSVQQSAKNCQQPAMTAALTGWHLDCSLGKDSKPQMQLNQARFSATETVKSWIFVI